MSDFGGLTFDQINDLGNKIGGQAGAKRIMSGDLILVEKDRKVSVSGLANGGVTYASGLDTSAFLADWEKYLEVVHNVRPNLSKIVLPPIRSGFGWGVIRTPELSAQKMLNDLKPRFNGKLWQWCPDVDAALDQNFEVRTTADGPYVCWFRDRVEADEEWKNKSADQLGELDVNCITEPERVALEGWFHWKTGDYLDKKNVTLSAGSRWSDGVVPGAYWHSDYGFYVDGCFADFRSDVLRAREAVSLPKAA